MNQQRKLMLVNKGLGHTKIGYFSKHFTHVSVVDVPEPAEDEEGGVKILSAAIKDQAPDIVVAGSRGAKLAVRCLHEGLWSGPTLILCGMMPSGMGTFPASAPVLLVHGINDITIPIHSVRICASTGWVKLIEVEDDHSLGSIIANDKLKNIVEELIQFASSPPLSSSTHQSKPLQMAAQSRSALLSAIKKKQIN